ncbi:hypothetical protein [Acidipropionibacterium acidipropionici]|uniref:hypothetical protein n=1 Tax=Acidipropionibacterium acidipropionici TaxID=1748 RepID=UPI000409A457|nr:hypothetical protein [Acidipropionibacterium acidipropionici]ALN14466.1 hypothetical protein ASQ49_03340 [Acidipropionibacterium acidipropionici]APZ09777.1 hypothetical protein BWX38_11595 [Acidipropionibacterium acidipropionici]
MLQTFGYLATAALGVLATWLLVRFVDHRSFRDLGLNSGWRRRLGDALIGVVVALAASALAILIGHGLGFMAGTELEWIYRDAPASQIISGVTYAALVSILIGVGGNTLWCGYVLRSISARPLVAVVVVAVVPSLVGVIPRPGQGMYSMQLASWLPSLPAEVGVGLAIVAFAIVFRSVWAAVGVTVGRSLITYAIPVPVGSPSNAGTLSVSVLTGVLFIIAALIALRMGRRRWRQFAETGPFDV